MKIVINKCYGGFGLSLKAQKRFWELQGKEIFFYSKTAYKYSHGFNEYKKLTNLNRNNFLAYVLTKDLGEVVNKLPIDYLFYDDDIKRDNPYLIQVIEELGYEANGSHADLKIVEIPDGVEWEIEEYDGIECVVEKHRVWQ